MWALKRLGLRLGCFVASAVASASLIMPPERSLAASRGAAKRMETLMQEIRVLGHLPNWTKEAPLALRLKRAKASEELSASQLAELEAMPAFSKRVTGACATEILMTEIRAFGRCPKRQQVDMKENALAERLRHFKRKKLLSASQLAELAELPAKNACTP